MEKRGTVDRGGAAWSLKLERVQELLHQALDILAEVRANEQPASKKPPLESFHIGPLSTIMLDFPVTGSPVKTWALTDTQVAEWAALFPGVDILAECRQALAWVKTNNPKTARGMPKFLVGWITRDVNKGVAIRLAVRSRGVAPAPAAAPASVTYLASCAAHGHAPPCASFALHLARRRAEDR